MENWDKSNDIFKSPQAFKKLKSTRFINEDKWESKEFKELKKDPVDLEIYNYFKALNQKGIALGYLDNQGEATFIPFEVRSTDIAKSPLSYLKGYLFDKYAEENEKYDVVKINPLTGQEELSLKRPYTSETIVGKKVSQQLDLFKVFEKFEQALNQYESLKNAEELIDTITQLEQEKTKELARSKKGVISGEKNKTSTADYERIKKLVNYRLYGKKFGTDIEISTPFGKMSFIKGYRMLDSYASQLFLGFYHKVAMAAYIGSSTIALSKKTKAYKKSNMLLSMVNPTESDLLGFMSNSKAIKKAFSYRITSVEKEEIELKRTNTVKNLAIHGWKYAANTLQVVDEKIQDDLFFAALRSSYVINNKIINAEDLKEQLYPDYYDNPSKYDKEFEDYIKDKPTLNDWVKENVKDNKLDLSSLDKESVFDFNQLVSGTAKEIIGNMSSEDYSYMRIGMFANIASKFKVWFPGVGKNFYSNLHYNRETKSTNIGSSNAFVSLFANSLSSFFTGKNLTKMESMKMCTSLLIPFLSNKNSASVRKFMRNKYKLYVEEGRQKGYLIEMSEKQYIDAYLEKSKSLINHFAITGLLLLINSFGGDDDDSNIISFLKQGLAKGIEENIGLSTPWGALQFVTKTSVPQIAAAGIALAPFATLLSLGLIDDLWLAIIQVFNSEGEALDRATKAVESDKPLPVKVLKQTLDAIPYVRQINRKLIIPYSEDWRDMLGVDKKYRVR